MPRWYALFQVRRCPPHLLLPQLAGIIKAQKLGRCVPRVCFERRAGRGEYYLGMAIESEVPGEPPREMERLLALPALLSPVRSPGGGQRLQALSRADLADFMGVDLAVEGYAAELRTASIERSATFDPFGPLSEQDAPLQDARPEKLLAWMSAYGEGLIDSFRAACAALQIVDPQRILRNLRLLGHAEQSADGRRWSISPTTCAGVRDGEGDAYVLCGARDSDLVARLREMLVVTELPQTGMGPPGLRIAVRAGTTFDLAAVADIEVVPHAALRLAEALPTFSQWRRALTRLPGLEPSRYEFHRYVDGEFIRAPFEQRSGLYQLWHRADAAAAHHRTLYYDGEQDEWIRGEWYALRFLERDARVPFEYDETTRRVACRRDRRLPEIYERALVLASGRLPRAEGEWVIYGSVSPELSKVLGQRLMHTE